MHARLARQTKSTLPEFTDEPLVSDKRRVTDDRINKPNVFNVSSTRCDAARRVVLIAHPECPRTSRAASLRVGLIIGTMQTNTASAAPTADADRIAILDALRGFALAGIFLINLGTFTGFAYMKPEAMGTMPTAALDRPAALVILWLGYGKFYSLFSLLFGIGFSLQLGAAERRGDDRLRVFRRRLAVLLAFGAGHMYFWEGDILFFYGIGFGLMGRVGPILWPPLVIAVVTIQVIVSRWWLSHFAFGPMEWLWRQATYARRLALRRADRAEASL